MAATYGYCERLQLSVLAIVHALSREGSNPQRRIATPPQRTSASTIEALKKHLKASKEHFEDLEKQLQRSANTKDLLKDFQMPSKGLLQTLHISSKGLVRP